LETNSSVSAPQTFIAKTIAGLETVLADELTALGAANIQILTRAVSFEGDQRMLYKANYCLRTAQRILVPIFSFQMADEDDLYAQVNAYAWENHLSLLKTLAVDAVVNGSELTHSHYVALLTKDAIVDRFRTISNGRRPSVDTENPHVRINIHINGSVCDVSIDSSGVSLHKRGYRASNAEAPLSEVLAAGLILLTGWKRDCHFIDPMCGSGTLLIEAAMIANNFPAGMYRKEFGFMHWPDFDAALWDEVTTEALSEQTEFEYQIIGSDISPKNLASARANVKSARLHKDIRLFVSPFAALQPPDKKPGLLVINPPYGERIRLNDIIGLYRSIGDTLKREFAGYQAWVISSDQKALSFIGLRPSAKLPVFNGQLECRYVHFDLYQGSKRGRYMTGDQGTDTGSEHGHAHSARPEHSAEGRSFADRKPDRNRTSDFPPRRREGDTENYAKPVREKRDREEFRREPRRAEEGSPRPERRFEKKEGEPFAGSRPGGDRPFAKRERPRFGEAPDRENSFRKAAPDTERKPFREKREEDFPTKAKPESDGIQVLPERAAVENTLPDGSLRKPSEGNKFTQIRDARLAPPRELRPRKKKEDEPVAEVAKPAAVVIPSVAADQPAPEKKPASVKKTAGVKKTAVEKKPAAGKKADSEAKPATAKKASAVKKDAVAKPAAKRVSKTKPSDTSGETGD
jgi:putative N6-adenine-specific DNA methylase